jgi:hypothetical protein
MPQTAMELQKEEAFLLSPDIKAGNAKNISYCAKQQQLRHTSLVNEQRTVLHQFMQRYVNYSTRLIELLFPSYIPQLQTGRTSYRPIEIAGRTPASYKKDDTRLHVDAFPTTPTQGHRILRVFCNINPNNVPRVWHIGEPFSQVAERFIPQIKKPSAFKAGLLKIFGLTKSLRTPYDHYMLNMHDNMKADMDYQNQVQKIRTDFPAGSTWIAYTDLVSHAALSGQYLLEQTFYLPYSAMLDENKAPIRILERYMSK